MVEEALHHTNCIANIAFISDAWRKNYGAVIYTTRSIGAPGRRNSDCGSCFSFAERHKLRFRFLSMLAIPAELPYINLYECAHVRALQAASCVKG